MAPEWIAAAVASATLLVLLADRVFGSGRNLAKEFARLDAHMIAQLTAFRNEVQLKREEAMSQVGDAMTGVRTQMHLQETRHLEFRAIVAETYLRRDSHYQFAEELKNDMYRRFDKLDERLERIENGQHGSK